MSEIDRTERVEECSMCGDEACCCHEVCDVCNGWKAQCGCIEQRECLDCGTTMDIIISLANGTSYICSKCYPDPFDRAEDKRYDVLDMLQEMEIDDE